MSFDWEGIKPVVTEIYEFEHRANVKFKTKYVKREI